MVGLPSPTRSALPLNLRTKLVISTATLLTIACLLLGWLFIRQHIRSVEEGLLQNGTLLAQHLAHTGRFSIVAGDTQRLERLVQESLTVAQVAYVAIASTDGRIRAGAGKNGWARQFVSHPFGLQHAHVTDLILLRFPQAGKDWPLISGLRLDETDGPILRPDVDFTTGELLRILGGADLPLYYDVTVRVPHDASAAPQDSALQLTFEDRLEGPSATEQEVPAIVQVGLSTSDLQRLLRRLLGQAAIITLTTLAAGLLIVVLLARRMTTPLQDLTAAATKLAAGETVPPVAVQTDDEIGTLTRVFNAMVGTLQAREQELRELTHTLEGRVETRTQELASANAKLQELDRRKSLFVSTASHELRTPLTSMKVHLANLRDGIDGTISEGQRRTLLRVEANLLRFQSLIEELLDLSRIEIGHTTLTLKPVAVNDALDRVVEELQPIRLERQAEIVFDPSPTLPLLLADEDKLHQILVNLVHNALKFSPVGSTVAITAEALDEREARIAVRDTGPGIPQEDIARIFEPFYRAASATKHTAGAGLGLTIARHLVELHHGRLTVESVLNGGSCFSVTLPTVEGTHGQHPHTTTRAGGLSEH